MKQHKIDFTYRNYLPDELNAEDKTLVKTALKATKTAYAPYSGFCVGVAARLTSGKIITGNNQENAAYPSGLCAERVAIFYIQSQYPKDPISVMALAASLDGKQTPKPIFPCGACRQVMLEHENIHGKKLRLLFAGSKIISEVKSASILLPLSFTGKSLRKHK